MTTKILYGSAAACLIAAGVVFDMGFTGTSCTLAMVSIATFITSYLSTGDVA